MADIINEDMTGATAPSDRYADGNRRLFYLHDLSDYKVHHDDPDVRGWRVKLSGGQVVGTVENLVVDRDAQLVRYLEVTTDRDYFSNHDSNDYYLDNDVADTDNHDGDDHFVVPLGMVRLDKSGNEVYVEGISEESIGGVPRYRRGTDIHPRYEYETINYYADQQPDYAGNYDRDRYTMDDPTTFRNLDDSFYTSGFFDRSRHYDRDKEAISSSGL